MFSKKEQIRALLKSIETGNTDAVSIVNEKKYIQHNPQTHEGSEGLAILFKRLSKTKPRVNMVRGFEDGEFVFAHMEYDFSSPKICFEVFRFENGQAVEHWDNIQERAGPNLSGQDMVGGPVWATGHEFTESNRALIKDFVQTILIDHTIDRLSAFIDQDQFVEHNPELGNDIHLLAQALLAKHKDGLRIDYHRLHRVLGEGNFVLSVCEGEKEGRHAAFYDLFRVENAKIVEHWDTTEHIAPSSEWKNNNGKF